MNFANFPWTFVFLGFHLALVNTSFAIQLNVNPSPITVFPPPGHWQDCYVIGMVIVPGNAYCQPNHQAEDNLCAEKYSPFIKGLQEYVALHVNATGKHVALWVGLLHDKSHDASDAAQILLNEAEHSYAVGYRRPAEQIRLSFKQMKFEKLLVLFHEDGNQEMHAVWSSLQQSYLAESYASIYVSSTPLRDTRERRQDCIIENESVVSEELASSSQFPSLILFGELDGVRRWMRYALEAFHILKQANSSSYWLSIDGANHQLLTAEAPWADFDLKAEKNLPAVQQAVYQSISLFLNSIVPSKWDSTAASELRQLHDETLQVFHAIWDGMLLSSNYNFLPPCHTYNNKHPRSVGCPCFVGSPWAELAQLRLMSFRLNRTRSSSPIVDTNNLSFSIADRVVVRSELHYPWSLNPIYHPFVEGLCSERDEQCSVNVTVFAHNSYLSSTVASYVEQPLSSLETVAKLKANQGVLFALGHRDVHFEETDGGPRQCADTNTIAWSWALRRLGIPTQVDEPHQKIVEAFMNKIDERLHELRMQYLPPHLQHLPLSTGGSVLKAFKMRFDKGMIMRLRMADDKGPLFNVLVWMFTELHLKVDQGAVEVEAVVSRFSEHFPLKLSRGIQYCKLLSVDRALEWFLTDGLRNHSLGY